jgi:D-galactose 1-dehydrogenase
VRVDPVRIALVGIGKIARDQHLPALAGNDNFRLIAAVSRHSQLEAVRTFADLTSMLASDVKLDAVSLCTPPQGRHELARIALDAGWHVMLEKPPAASVSEVIDLEARARAAGRTLFTTWHSREAAGAEPARAWLAERLVKSVRITWKEDIRVWHPGQEWILQAGGLGVFDPGINALSILTRILPRRLTLDSASLHFPRNRQAPISAELVFIHDAAARVTASFDFLYAGPPRWDIEVTTNNGTLVLSQGGQQLHIDGVAQAATDHQEYSRLYQRFAELVATGASEVDTTPLQLVADAFLLGERHEVAAFEF